MNAEDFRNLFLHEIRARVAIEIITLRHQAKIYALALGINKDLSQFDSIDQDKISDRIIYLAYWNYIWIKCFDLEFCHMCDGSGKVDSGGFSPCGEPIYLPCPECAEKLKEFNL